MSLKLFKVEITAVAYVLAEDAREAEKVARWNRIDIGDGDAFATKVKPGHEVEGEWRGRSLPFVDGKHNVEEKTVEQLVSEIAP